MRRIFTDNLSGHRLQLAKLDAGGKRLAVLDRRGATAPPVAVYESTAGIWRRVPSPEFEELPLSLAFSPDGSRVIVSTERRLWKFDVGTQKVEECLPSGGAGASELEWFEDERVAAAYPERWPPADVLSLRERGVLPLAPPLREVAKHIPRLAVSHDLATIAFCHAFEFVFLFDTRSGNATRWGDAPRLTTSNAPENAPWEWTHFARRIWFSADDTEIAVASHPRGQDEWEHMGIRIGMRDGSRQRLLPVKSHMGSVDFTPDFDVVAAAVIGQPGDVALWETRTNGVREVIHMGVPTRDIRFSGDGRLLVITCEESLAIFER